MTQKPVYMLLERQFEIQQAIKELNDELLDVSNNIFNLLKDENVLKATAKQNVLDVLRSKGFNVSSINKNSNILLNVKNETKQYFILHRQSKYYTENSYNAWYTLKPNVEDMVDFFIFSYFNKNQKDNCIIVDKQKMIQVISLINRTPEGRVHINLKESEGKVIEVNSNVDFTKYINNFDSLS